MNEHACLTIAQIEAILQFLSRTQISGAEAIILVSCVQALQGLAEAAKTE
jgi:hypothetical protein